MEIDFPVCDAQACAMEMVGFASRLDVVRRRNPRLDGDTMRETVSGRAERRFLWLSLLLTPVRICEAYHSRTRANSDRCEMDEVCVRPCVT